MKKILFVLLLMISITASSQNKVYCELLGSQKFMSSKVYVTVDFGQATSFWTGYSKQYLVDENGKAKDFNSMVDAMNFMGKLGWKFEQAYVLTVSSQNVMHWLLSKDITNDEEIKKGITTKEDFKKTHPEE